MNKVRSPVIWVGDVIAHNPKRRSQVSDRNGTAIEELLDSCNLVVINDGNPTRYKIGANKMSCIDLTITSAALARVGEWDVFFQDTIGSDHFPILSSFRRTL